MIDTLGATVAAAVVGGLLVATATRLRHRSTRATAWLVSAALGVNLLFGGFDAWSMGGTTDLASDAQFGGLTKTVHHVVLIAICGWSVLLAGIVVLGRDGRCDLDHGLASASGPPDPLR